MADVQTIIKFDGKALDGNSMDVAHLAPSLLALSDLLKEANQYANGDRAGIKVFVNADLEQKCFELVVELSTTIWESAKLLIADDRVKTAKEIAEWVGIIGGTGFGLFQLIKWLKNKTIKNVTVIKIDDGQNMVEISVEGESDVKQITQTVYELYANVVARQKAIKVMAPLKEEGYETLEFYEKDEVFVHFEKDDVPSNDGDDLPEVIPQNVHKSTIKTGVRIRKAAYEGASKWTLIYKKAIDAPIDDEEWLSKFQSGAEKAPPGSSLSVDLEETYITNENAEIMGDPTYRVIKVHSVELPMRQKKLDLTDAKLESGKKD